MSFDQFILVLTGKIKKKKVLKAGTNKRYIAENMRLDEPTSSYSSWCQINKGGYVISIRVDR